MPVAPCDDVDQLLIEGIRRFGFARAIQMFDLDIIGAHAGEERLHLCLEVFQPYDAIRQRWAAGLAEGPVLRSEVPV